MNDIFSGCKSLKSIPELSRFILFNNLIDSNGANNSKKITQEKDEGSFYWIIMYKTKENDKEKKTLEIIIKIN